MAIVERASQLRIDAEVVLGRFRWATIPGYPETVHVARLANSRKIPEEMLFDLLAKGVKVGPQTQCNFGNTAAELLVRFAMKRDEIGVKEREIVEETLGQPFLEYVTRTANDIKGQQDAKKEVDVIEVARKVGVDDPTRRFLGKTPEEVIADLSARGFKFNHHMRDIFDKADTRRTIRLLMPPYPGSMTLVMCALKDLGFNNHPTPEQILKRLAELGLEPCLPRVGPELREAWTEQPEGETVLVAMQPIMRELPVQGIWELKSEKSDKPNAKPSLSLFLEEALPSHMYSPDVRFVAVLPEAA